MRLRQSARTAGLGCHSLQIGAEPGQAGQYRGLVTNGCGSTATATITVTVTPAASGEVVFASGFE
jgi:hypothetical protein